MTGANEAGKETSMLEAGVQLTAARDSSGQPREKCTGCGSTEGVLLYPDRAEVLCPKCANLYMIGDAARRNLAQLISLQLPAWREHWLVRGAEPGWLDETVEVLGDLVDTNEEREKYGFKPRSSN